jgi:hypothetical protein
MIRIYDDTIRPDVGSVMLATTQEFGVSASGDDSRSMEREAVSHVRRVVPR